MTQAEKMSLLDYVFSPTAPIEQEDLFYGRISQLQYVHSAITQRGAHAVLYGDRGVGKTSLANIATKTFAGVVVSKVTCNRTEDFKAIWEKALKKIRFKTESNGIGFNAEPNTAAIQLDLFLPEKSELDSTDIEHVFENLVTPILIIFDEFDSVTSGDVRTRMADTIKALSDNVPNVTIFIVGIAENVNGLLGEHPSLERCLIQVQMPRMSDDELKEIIENGLTRLELEIIGNVKEKIIDYSSGFPHYTHAICKYAAHLAIHQNENTISIHHFTYAVKRSIENASQSLRDSYQKAIITSKGASQFEDILAACAMSELDEYNCFSSSDMLTYLKLDGKVKNNATTKDVRYYLETLSKSEKGKILEKVGQASNIKYRFTNPMMRAFIRLKIHDKKSTLPNK